MFFNDRIEKSAKNYLCLLHYACNNKRDSKRRI